MRKPTSALLLASGMLGFVACGGVPAPAGDGTQTPDEEIQAPQTATGETAKDCPSNRSDYSTYITPGTGTWGDWATCWDWCPVDTYAYAVRLKSEPEQGGGMPPDDTALNAVSIRCYPRGSSSMTTYVTSTQGDWGTWGTVGTCSPTDGPITAARMQIEASQGSGNNDDTAANDLHARCRNGIEIEPSANTSWGDWGAWASCPSGTVVCGIKTRVEAHEDGDSFDDTALNGVRFACCNF